METGWIHSAACSLKADPKTCYYGTDATRLFVYSTPDSYQHLCIYNGINSDHYNHWGGFVEYPNMPFPIGVYGYGSVFLKHSYDYNEENTSTTFSLTPFVLGEDGIPSFHETIAKGHYSSSHYCKGISTMDQLQVGLEVRVSQSLSPGIQTAVGNIYGWGSERQFPIQNKFTSFPPQSDWTIEYPTPNHVTFSGTQKDVNCIWNLTTPCCIDPPKAVSCKDGNIVTA